MDLIIVVEVILDGGKVFIVFKDNMMKMWDLRIGKVMKIIYEVGINIIRICVGYNVVFVIIVEENVIQVWNFWYLECVLCVDKYFDFFVIGMVGEGKYLCVLFDGNNIL